MPRLAGGTLHDAACERHARPPIRAAQRLRCPPPAAALHRALLPHEHHHAAADGGPRAPGPRLLLSVPPRHAHCSGSGKPPLLSLSSGLHASQDASDIVADRVSAGPATNGVSAASEPIAARVSASLTCAAAHPARSRLPAAGAQGHRAQRQRHRLRQKPAAGGVVPRLAGALHGELTTACRQPSCAAMRFHTKQRVCFR